KTSYRNTLKPIDLGHTFDILGRQHRANLGESRRIETDDSIRGGLLRRNRAMPSDLSIHEKLSELAGNLWWSWQPEVTTIFREIDPGLWSNVAHNPFRLLEEYPPDRLEQRAR